MAIPIGYGESGWQRDDPVAGPGPGLDGPAEAEYVVVGAGLAGLALAHQLAQRVDPAGILVLEAGRAGDGASGRSTGIGGPGVGGPITATVKRYGPEVARAMFGASLAGIDQLRQLTKELPDDCELIDSHQLVTAVSPGHAVRLRGQVEVLRDQLGFDVRYLDRAATTERLGTDRYHGALCYPDVITVNPWLLCRALRADLLRRGVRVAEGTPVTSVTGGERVTLTAGGHRVTAGRVVLTTDGFVSSFGLYRRHVATIRTHVLRTAPVPAELLARTGWDGQGAMIDSRSFFNYYRLTARGHLLFGGGPAVLDHRACQRCVDAIETRLVRELAGLFPALAELPVTDFWSGKTASTFDRLPIVGPVPHQPNVWFVGAWCGHGLSLSALTASQLAGPLTGTGPGPEGPVRLPWWRDRAGWMPSGRSGSLLLTAYLRGLDGADRLARSGEGRTGGGRPAAAGAYRATGKSK